MNKHKIFAFSFTLLFVYVNFRRTVKNMWFENDFKDVFPEVFYPYKKRYEINERPLHEEILNLKYNIKEDIAERRKLNTKN